MKKAIKAWWEAERIGRPEAETSQDMCPTNGDAVIFRIIMLIAWSPFAIYMFVTYMN
jgi:hypothetical protein